MPPRYKYPRHTAERNIYFFMHVFFLPERNVLLSVKNGIIKDSEGVLRSLSLKTTGNEDSEGIKQVASLKTGENKDGGRKQEDGDEIRGRSSSCR